MRPVNGKSTFTLAIVLVSAFIIGLVFLNSGRGISMRNRDGSRWTIGKFDADENEEKEREGERGGAEWFLRQRTYPLGYIPQDAEIRAVDDLRHRMIPELAAQGVRLQKSAAAQLNWTYLGPGNIGGRLRGIVVHPNDPNIIYAGSVSGGVWKSTNGGASWSPSMNDLITLNVSALAMKPGDPNTIYAGTGEAFLTGDALPGRGLLKTTDGGNTWKRVHVAQGLNSPFITAIAVSPANPNVVYASGRQAVPQISVPAESVPDPGVSAIFKSIDGGETWQDVTTGKGLDQNPQDMRDNFATDVVVSPTDANVVYATFGIFASGGIWKSTNGGQTWSRLTNGLPDPNLPNQGYNRIKLAMAPSNPNTLYASISYLKKDGDTVNLRDEALLGLWKTTNAGQSWTQVTTPLTVNQRNRDSGNTTALGCQGSYANALVVHPTNPNIVFIAGLDIYKSTDGGNTWSQVSMWIPPGDFQNPQNLPYVHADHHVLTFDLSSDPPVLYDGSDGGVARSRDLGTTWEVLNHDLGVTQFYGFAVHPTNSKIMVGGSQDNGTPMVIDGNANNWFEAANGGDGWKAYFDFNNPTTLYTAVYSVKMLRWTYDFTTGQAIDLKAIGYTDGSNGITQDDVNGSDFFAPYEMSPNNPNVLVLGTNRLLKTTDGGNTWKALSNAISVPIASVAIAEGNDNDIWIATASAQIFKTEDNGATYTNVTGANLPKRFITDIEFDPSNNRTVYLTYSGYGSPHVFKSTDAGANWANITNNLPDAPANTIQVHPQQPNTIFLGTDIGVFLSENGGQTWQPCTNGFPTVPVVAIVLNTNRTRIFAATHGRGVFSAQLSGGGGAAVLSVDAQEMNIDVKPEQVGNASFNISNNGGAALNYSITTSGQFGNVSLSTLNGKAGLSRANVASRSFLPIRKSRGTGEIKAQMQSLSAAAAEFSSVPSLRVMGNDVLVLDDGNDTSDGFVGQGPGSPNDFYWLNQFDLAGQGFQLEAIQVYMRTESAGTNKIAIAVMDTNGDDLVRGTVTMGLSTTGHWYTVQLNTPLNFTAGQGFLLEVGADASIAFPAGTDKHAQVRNHSYYFDWDNGYQNLNTVAGFEQGAFLIRAVGTKTGGANQPPVAKALVSKLQANVNETLTFDASQSIDPDGQIVQYLWNFGDGNTSNQKVATHAYAQAGTFTVTLTVTDNLGASGQVSGQITITGGSNQPPVARGQISSTNVHVNEAVTFDASTSSDPDGQITQYLWNFGDGATSMQTIATHAYAQAGTYTVTLIVTDNKGATGQASGQITVTPATTSRLTVDPVSGTIAAGGAQTINVRFDAQGLAEGNYVGQIYIVSNGGNQTIPVQIRVSNNIVSVAELSYDNGTPTTAYNWPQVGQGSAVRFTPPSKPAKVTQAKIFITDIANGNQFNLRVLADANGKPGNTIYGPAPVTVANTGWATFDLSAANISVNGDFYVMIEYNGTSKPDFGSEKTMPISKRSWDFDGQNWALFDTEDYLIRAVVEYTTSVADHNGEASVPERFELAQNYPNPFNPETTIKYQLPARAQVALAIYDLTGRRVAIVESGMKETGDHLVRWNGRDDEGRRVASGVYFYRLEATPANGRAVTFTKKLTVLK